jgi:hypothetical protein
MLATTFRNATNSLEVSYEPRLTTYIPSPFFLLLAVENGWKITRIELVPSEDQLSLVYLVTLQSDSSKPDQKLILPTNALVKKILAQNSQISVPVGEGALI